MQETQEKWVWSLGQEDLLEQEMATHSSILAWKILWMEEPGRLQFTGLQRVWTWLSDFTFFLSILRVLCHTFKNCFSFIKWGNISNMLKMVYIYYFCWLGYWMVGRDHPHISYNFLIYLARQQTSIKYVKMAFLLSFSMFWTQSAALNMPTYLENSAVATGLEKVSFHSNPEERQCQCSNYHTIALIWAK